MLLNNIHPTESQYTIYRLISGYLCTTFWSTNNDRFENETNFRKTSKTKTHRRNFNSWSFAFIYRKRFFSFCTVTNVTKLNVTHANNNPALVIDSLLKYQYFMNYNKYQQQLLAVGRLRCNQLVEYTDWIDFDCIVMFKC